MKSENEDASGRGFRFLTISLDADQSVFPLAGMAIASNAPMFRSSIYNSLSHCGHLGLVSLGAWERAHVSCRRVYRDDVNIILTLVSFLSFKFGYETLFN